MKPDKVQERALKTWYLPDHELHFSLTPSFLGLVGEAGELANLLKKDLYKPNIKIDADTWLDELGDCLYYLAIATYQLGITIDELSKMNREKLSGGKNGWPETS